MVQNFPSRYAHQTIEGAWQVSVFPAPIDVLPHRAPFLFIDSISELSVGMSAVGRWKLKGDEWFFPGHFPGRPTLPGVLMCEAIAQLGAYTLLAAPEHAHKLPLFGGIDTARFRRQVVPGDELELQVQLGRISARAGKGSGKALVNGELACELDLMFVFATQ